MVERGSKASRTPSPKNEKASVVTAMAADGKITAHGYEAMPGKAWLTIVPQVGVLGSTPRPRKVSVASAMILAGKASVTRTITGARMLGMIWRITSWRSVAPTLLAAIT